jgi:hypothetical protein
VLAVTTGTQDGDAYERAQAGAAPARHRPLAGRARVGPRRTLVPPACPDRRSVCGRASRRLRSRTWRMQLRSTPPAWRRPPSDGRSCRKSAPMTLTGRTHGGARTPSRTWPRRDRRLIQSQVVLGGLRGWVASCSLEMDSRTSGFENCLTSATSRDQSAADRTASERWESRSDAAAVAAPTRLRLCYDVRRVLRSANSGFDRSPLSSIAQSPCSHALMRALRGASVCRYCEGTAM